MSVLSFSRLQAEEVADLLRHKEAHVFVCGDGSQMAKDVHEALLKILETEDNLSPAEATSKLMAMTKAGRYIRDIWSWVVYSLANEFENGMSRRHMLLAFSLQQNEGRMNDRENQLLKVDHFILASEQLLMLCYAAFKFHETLLLAYAVLQEKLNYFQTFWLLPFILIAWNSFLILLLVFYGLLELEVLTWPAVL